MDGILILDDPTTSSPDTPLLQEIREAIGEAYDKIFELRSAQDIPREVTM